jgi:hypothetical protein
MRFADRTASQISCSPRKPLDQRLLIHSQPYIFCPKGDKSFIFVAETCDTFLGGERVIHFSRWSHVEVQRRLVLKSPQSPGWVRRLSNKCIIRFIEVSFLLIMLPSHGYTDLHRHRYPKKDIEQKYSSETRFCYPKTGKSCMIL